MRPTLGGSREAVTQTYAVCPSCNERQEFSGKPTSLRCTRCKHDAAVDWSVTC
jgi:tRNA(Ile2) C34 agmatinyltransferase TiaS